MNVLEQIKTGFWGYLKAFQLVFTKGFAKYLIFPFLINVLIFVVGINYIFDLSDYFQKMLADWIIAKGGTSIFILMLSFASAELLKILIYLLFFIIFMYTSGYLVLIVLSPVFAGMSEKAEYKLTGKKNTEKTTLKQLLSDILRGIYIALRNLTVQIIITVVLFFTGFIPVVGWWISPILMFLVTAYFFGFSYMDYTNERHKRGINDSVALVRKYRWVAITNGAVFSIFLIIPYFGIMISAFIAVFSILAGTVSIIEIEKHAKSKNIGSFIY